MNDRSLLAIVGSCCLALRCSTDADRPEMQPGCENRQVQVRHLGLGSQHARGSKLNRLWQLLAPMGSVRLGTQDATAAHAASPLSLLFEQPTADCRLKHVLDGRSGNPKQDARKLPAPLQAGAVARALSRMQRRGVPSLQPNQMPLPTDETGDEHWRELVLHSREAVRGWGSPWRRRRLRVARGWRTSDPKRYLRDGQAGLRRDGCGALLPANVCCSHWWRHPYCNSVTPVG